MDISVFSKPDFDTKEWLNQTVKGNESEDMSVALLSIKLQRYLQQVNDEMESTSQQLICGLPRIIRDVEILTEEAFVLKEKMDSVKQEIAKVEQGTGQSIKSLERIDQIKTELLRAREALHEANKWNILVIEIEKAFKAQDIESVASKLVSMQQSLVVLSNTSDYDLKRQQLELLRDRLDDLISPLLQQAFVSRSTEHTKKIVQIFVSINRLSKLENHFSKMYKESLIQQWKQLLKVETEEGLVESLHTYYDLLIINWQEQVKWSEQVFPNMSVCKILIDVYTDTLTSLSQEMTALFQKVLQHMSDPITLITVLKQQTTLFADNLKHLLSKNPKVQNSHQILHNLAKSIYLPYVSWISKYGVWEQAALHAQSSVFSETSEDLIDYIPNLLHTNSKVFNIALETKKRCCALTEGAGYPGLFFSLEYYFNMYLEKYKWALGEIERQRNNFEEFSMFQLCLRFLECMGDFLISIKQIEVDFCQGVTEFFDKCTQKDTHPFVQWHKLLLNKVAEDELYKCVANIKQKEVLFKTTSSSLQELCKTVHHTTFNVIFAPIREQLESVKSIPSSTDIYLSNDLPDYSFSPQEYITQIGQYLLTLPQHLEPFLLIENSALTLALSLISSEYDPDRKSEDTSFADIFLGNISDATCKTYCEFILNIDHLSTTACKQIATDIDYLGNVLGDLGFSLPAKVQNIALLLRLTPSEYSSKSSGCNFQIVSAIRRMRNITSE